ncbi:hypothetical protein K492DRAFT_204403 [Lichtheimia hyalospora FSU 10163]|nr:hypothetical protein K492DRAFT_204403 [Lichtheimia hyalospora FSU 10163]
MQPPSHLTSRRQRKIWEQQQRDNAVKRQKKDIYENQTPFRHAERHFKLTRQLDFSNVVDFDLPPDAKDKRIVSVSLHNALPESLFGKATDTAYILKGVNGLIYIPNPFSPDKQRHYVKQCLSTYALPPNKSNLDPHYKIPAQGLWHLYTKEQKEEEEEEEEAKIVSINNHEQQVLPSDIMHKLRWITLGYQYDWTTKKYNDEAYLIADDLSELTKAIVAAIEGIGQQNEWKNTYSSDKFKAEAGVINYYQLKDTLMGHVDQSERNMDAPLISLSFGHACIYLLGGTTRDTEPIPIHLKSGDLLIMTGQCRKAYHGVPRIIENSLPEYLSPCIKDDDWKLYGSYMKTSRINLNIRQVE